MDENSNPLILRREDSDKMELEWRKGSPGYWAAWLFPLALMVTPSPTSSRVTWSALVVIALNTLILTIIHHLNLFHHVKALKDLFVLLALMALSVCYIFTDYVAAEYVPIVFLVFTFVFVFCNVIKWYPRSFTFGEGIIVTSAFVYNIYVASQNIPSPKTFNSLQESDKVILFVQMGFLGTIILARCLVVIVKQFEWYGLEELFVIWAKIMLAAFIIHSPNEDLLSMVSWVRHFLIGTEQRGGILGLWTIIVGLAGVYVKLSSQAASTTTIHRKIFHFFIVFVYAPVVQWDISLLYFCSAGVMFVFILTEAIRALKFEYWGIKFGPVINKYVSTFRDHQDEGKLILTPIYLLAGLSLPIWLTGLYSENGKVVMSPESIAACLTGVLSVGIGDSCASIGGTLFGKHYFSESRKTWEGTFCSIASQMVAIGVLYIIRVLPFTSLSCFALCVSVIANAIVESQTDQIDNLVVPLTAYNVFHLVLIFRDFIPLLSLLT